MKDQILRLRKQGKTYKEISLELNCSTSTVSYHLNPEVRDSVLNKTSKRREVGRKIVEKIKKNLSCSSCGESRYWLLDFHHTDPSKKEIRVSAMKSYKKEKILEEIDKCEVLCANCHRDLHYKEKSKI